MSHEDRHIPPVLSHGTRPSIHRAAPPIRLPVDPLEAGALIVDFIRSGGTGFERASAIEAAGQRLARLKDAKSGQAEDEILMHAMVLDALFQHWAARSLTTSQPDHAVKFAKLAMQSQAGHARSIIAVESLRMQREGKATVLPLDGDSDSDD